MTTLVGDLNDLEPDEIEGLTAKWPLIMASVAKAGALAEAAEAEVERLKSDVADLVRAGSDEATENARLREALDAIATERVGNRQRFAEDDDTDFFMRWIGSIKNAARAALTGDLTNG